MRIPHFSLLLTIILFTIGCESNKTSSIDLSLKEYHQGQWRLSEMWAKKAIESGESIDEAEYMVGLCEFQLHNIASSKQCFEKASKSSNEEVQGKAEAMLGIIASSNGNYAVAEIAFKSASIHLRGNDKREAVARCGNALVSGEFTLQFGAYRSKGNAEIALNTLSESLANTGLGTPRITKEVGTLGKTMFLVQAGRFTTRKIASSRCDHGDLPQCIVAVSP
jgi:tetratricopeptide (TPR) repeat protein